MQTERIFNPAQETLETRGTRGPRVSWVYQGSMALMAGEVSQGCKDAQVNQG